MTSLITLFFVVIMILVDVIFILLITHKYKKINAIFLRNKTESQSYSRNMFIGITSGIIVIVSEKVITLGVTNLPKLDTSSFFPYLLQ